MVDAVLTGTAFARDEKHKSTSNGHWISVPRMSGKSDINEAGGRQGDFRSEKCCEGGQTKAGGDGNMNIRGGGAREESLRAAFSLSGPIRTAELSTTPLHVLLCHGWLSVVRNV